VSWPSREPAPSRCDQRQTRTSQMSRCQQSFEARTLADPVQGKTRMPDQPLVIDPTIVGPFDRCFTCFQPITNKFRYCENCGRTHLFNYGDLLPGQHCFNHPTVAATAICRSCNNSIRDDCTGARGFSMLSGESDAECKNCLMRIVELKKSFKERLEKTKMCAKHPTQTALLRCAKCALPHCEACLYFTRKVFRTRLAKGPLCLTCFRERTGSDARNSWISAREAMARGLLRGVDPNLIGPIQQRSATGRFLALKKTSRGVR
jgi:hypothetical protein